MASSTHVHLLMAHLMQTWRNQEAMPKARSQSYSLENVKTKTFNRAEAWPDTFLGHLSTSSAICQVVLHWLIHFRGVLTTRVDLIPNHVRFVCTVFTTLIWSRCHSFASSISRSSRSKPSAGFCKPLHSELNSHTIKSLHVLFYWRVLKDHFFNVASMFSNLISNSKSLFRTIRFIQLGSLYQ